MSVSDKQLEANRQNAKKSTGPKTEQGKAVSSKNSLKHGFHSREVVINSPRHKEDPDEYNTLFDAMCDELKPQTLFQKYLVRKIANCLWRSQRAVIAETAQLNTQMTHIKSEIEFHSNISEMLDTLLDSSPDNYEPDMDDLCRKANLVGLKSIPNEMVGRNIMYYEMRLDRQLTRTYKLLRYLQLSQKTESLPNRGDAD